MVDKAVLFNGRTGKGITKENVLWWLMLLSILMIPISQFVGSRLFVLTFFVALPGFNFKSFLLNAWDVLFYLLVLLLGLLYSTDWETGLKVLETNFSLLAVPVIFCAMDNFNDERKKKSLEFFSLGVVIACLVVITNASVRSFESANPNFFLFYNLTEVIGSHPTYTAYYIIFAITIGLYWLYSEHLIFLRKTLTLLAIILFCFVLILTGGQTAFVSLLLVFSFFLLKFILGERSVTQRLIIGLIVTMMAVMFFVSSTQKGERENGLNDSWDRFALWNAAIDANPNLLFGVGTGDYKIVSNEYFRVHHLNEYAKDSLNAHNQFIQLYLSNGLFGILGFILLLGRPLYISFKNTDSFGILVFFPFLIYGMTEVFLGRYQGVVFFVLLHQVIISHHNSSKPTFPLKEA